MKEDKIKKGYNYYVQDQKSTGGLTLLFLIIAFFTSPTVGFLVPTGYNLPKPRD